MAEATIPVDPTNPGQVFACLGFMEAAEILLGDAEAGFTWDEAPTRFRLRARGEENPVAAVLTFLAEAQVRVLAPAGSEGLLPSDALVQGVFPSPTPDNLTALPARLQGQSVSIDLSHWADATGRETFKTFAGRQIGFEIIKKILVFNRRPQSSQSIQMTINSNLPEISADPFSFELNAPSAFGFDARGAWDAMRAGLSLDTLGMPTRVSALVELLAATGLEHARPVQDAPRAVSYAIWQPMLLPALARLAFARPGDLGCASASRRFLTHTGGDKYYKKFYFALEQ